MMVFSSSTFLLAFLPITLLLYFIIPTRAAKNIVLLVLSLVFYAWGEPVYVFLMMASIVLNWGIALLVGKNGGDVQGGSGDTRCVDSMRSAGETERQKSCNDNGQPRGNSVGRNAGGNGRNIGSKRFGSHRQKHLWFIIGLVANLGVLGFFKYEGFLAHNLNLLFGSEVITNLELPLPIGISFFTLQAVSYIIDVYRGEVEAQRNPLYLGMYIAMFPQLIAGPIVRYQTIQEQIIHRKESVKDFSAGLRLFIVGLSKKVLLANTVAILASKMLEAGGAGIGFLGAWAGLLAYTFQIFFDFSGYSDMAIGLGKMFGFSYLRNFNYPYISKSVTEFWRRWHISLSSFFRDYVYIPLGGNRVSRPRWCFNLCIVWGLTGFWHGAAWNYIAWGLFYGAILLCEKLFLVRRLHAAPALLQHLYTIVVFMLGWLIFWIEDPTVFAPYFGALFGAHGLTGLSSFWELTAWEYGPVLFICACASTPIVPWMRARLSVWAEGRTFDATDFAAHDLVNVKSLATNELCSFDSLDTSRFLASRRPLLLAVSLVVDIALLCLLVLSMISIVSGSFNPFIYFRF